MKLRSQEINNIVEQNDVIGHKIIFYRDKKFSCWLCTKGEIENIFKPDMVYYNKEKRNNFVNSNLVYIHKHGYFHTD